MNIFGSKAICHFHARAIARGRKWWFHLRMSRILFAAKHSWTALLMSRPLFVGSYLQVRWCVLGQWKGRKICIGWLKYRFIFASGKNIISSLILASATTPSPTPHSKQSHRCLRGHVWTQAATLFQSKPPFSFCCCFCLLRRVTQGSLGQMEREASLDRL